MRVAEVRIPHSVHGVHVCGVRVAEVASASRKVELYTNLVVMARANVAECGMRIADGRIGAERRTLESLRKRVKLPFSASTQRRPQTTPHFNETRVSSQGNVPP